MTLDTAIQSLEAKSLRVKCSCIVNGFKIGTYDCEYSPGSFRVDSPVTTQVVSYDSNYKVVSLVEHLVDGTKMDLTAKASDPMVIQTALAADPRHLYNLYRSHIAQASQDLYVYEGPSAIGSSPPGLVFRAEFYLSKNGDLERLVSGTFAKASFNSLFKKNTWLSSSEVVF